MAPWWTVGYWRKMNALDRQRVRLALLLWPFLSARERAEDDATPLWLVARMVKAVEKGGPDFPDDAAAQQLWDRASADQEVQQAASDVRTLRLQLSGEAAASPVPVVAPSRKDLKLLQERMRADRLDDGVQWLHAPITLPLVSALFLFSGWLFNAIFFANFGMPVGRFFGLSDYLAASMDSLVPVGIAMGITFLIQWASRSYIRLQMLQNRLGWQSIAKNVLAVVVTLPFVAFVHGTQDPAEQTLITVFIVLLAVFLSAIQLLTSFSRSPMRDSLLLTFTVIYLVVVWYSAELRYVKLDENTRPAEVTLAHAPDRPEQWRVVSGNSLYLFLVNDQNELVAVPVEQVLSVRYPKPESASSAESPAPSR